MREGFITRLVFDHQGIQTVRTHRKLMWDGSQGRERSVVCNTITCRDGFVRTLTTKEEEELARTLPDDLRAFVHEIEE